MPLCVKQTPGINPALPHAWLPHAWHCLPANCTCEASTWFCLTFSFSWFSLPWWMWDGFFLYAISRKKSSSPFFPSSLFDSYSYNMLSFFLFVYAVGENGQLKVPMLTNKQKITAILIYRTTIYFFISRTILPVAFFSVSRDFFKKYCYSLKNWDLVHHGGEAEEEVVEASVGISGMFRACRLLAPLRVNAQLRLLAA